jgi:hypothetical protein
MILLGGRLGIGCSRIVDSFRPRSWFAGRAQRPRYAECGRDFLLADAVACRRERVPQWHCLSASMLPDYNKGFSSVRT